MPVANTRPKRLRREAKLSQRQLSELSGVTRQAISRLESGGNVNNLTVEKVAEGLSKALGREIPSDYLITTLGDVITRQRAIRGLTIEALAQEIGVSARTIQGWTRGRGPHVRHIAALSEALDIDPLELQDLGFQQVPQTPVVQKGESNRTTVLEKIAEAIPSQSPLIHFGVSDNARLRLVPSLADENDYETIEALRSELLASHGPIERLRERYAQAPNVPQAGVFGPLTARYDEELSKDPRDINYTILYARGARFYAARRTAAQQVTSGEWPEPSAEEADAIETICDLHGPLIMASAVGRRLVADAHEYEATPEVYREEEALLQEFGEALGSEADLFEPDAVEAIEDITVPIPDDPQPARSRGTRIVFAGSALSVVVGGAAWYAAGGVVAAAVVPAALVGAVGLGGAFLWEVTKKTEHFKQATDDLAKRADTVIVQAEQQADQKQNKLLERMADLVDRRRDLFERISSLRPEFSWAKRFLKPNDPTFHKTPINLGDVVRSAAGKLINSANKRGIRSPKMD